MKTYCLIALFCTSFLLIGCGTISQHAAVRTGEPGLISEAEKARAVLDALVNLNSGLDSFKGIGKATFRSNGTRQSVRVAWMGSGRDRIRIEVLDPAGRPVVSFANDGDWVYLLSRNPPRFYKKRSAGASLKNVLAIPVQSNDIIALISGRAPLREYRSVHLILSEENENRPGTGRDNPPAAERVLVLKRFWGLVVQKIFFDEALNEIRQVEIYDTLGSLAYRAVFESMQNIDGYRVPSALLISNDADAAFRLDIRRYWADVRVEPSQFVLIPPEAIDRRE